MLGRLLCAAALLCAFPSGLLAAAGEPLLRLEVEVSRRLMTVVVDGRTAAQFEVAVGKPRNPTPRGEYTIDRVIWNPWWAPPDSPWAQGRSARPPGHPANPMQAVKIPFRPLYYIHGTDRPDSIGKAASHGCIRMRVDDVVELAKIMLWYTGDDREPDWYHHVLDERKQSETPLALPVALVIRE